MSDWLTEAIARATAYDEGYQAGRYAAVEQIFEKLKEDLRGYIGLNYLDDLKEKYADEFFLES